MLGNMATKKNMSDYKALTRKLYPTPRRVQDLIPVFKISQDGISLGLFELSACREVQLLSGMHLYTADQSELCFRMLQGSACIRRLMIQPDTQS